MLTGRYREPHVYPPADSRNRFYKFFQEPGFSKAIQVVHVLDEIAAERNVPLAQIALNWVTQKDFISTGIVGCQTRKNVEQNVASFDWKLSDSELARLDAVIDRCIRNA